MGLLGFAGKLVVGTLKVGVKVAGAALGAASNANKVRQNASSMSNSELVDAYKNSTSATKRAGYEAAIRERTGNW